MISQLSHVMTLANSIIGVSVLAMPFCFKQCGIVLATLVLLLSSILSRLASHFLIKSAVMSRRRNFELLAFHAFGHMGKILVELFIIGFLVGTCIAFFVVMGDLGPQIVGKVIDKNPENIRTSLLVTTSVFIVLPLGLLKNIDSLSSLCTATIIFYFCLVLKIITESIPRIFAGDWYENVYYWRPSEKMNQVVRGALNICTSVYLCVGFFGYIAFCTQPFTGNILMSFKPSLSSEMIKMGFVFSIAFSFPLVIFPCRASLNSLLFRRMYTHEPSITYLPETRFRCLTIIIVIVSLITGIMIPNIEFVLGLVGSTIGVMICLILPAIFFISISSKHTNERLLAQVILFIGICIMILSTYANLYALEKSTTIKILTTTSKSFNEINSLSVNLKNDINGIASIPKNPKIVSSIRDTIEKLPELNVPDNSLNLQGNDMRQEPPIPVERIVVTEKSNVETQKSVDNILITLAPLIKETAIEIKTVHENLGKQSKDIVKNEIITIESVTKKKDEIDAEKVEKNFVDLKKNDNLINSDAIKKEETELAADAESANLLAVERHEKLRQTLEKHKQEQLQMMEEQKEILKDLKLQKNEIEKEKQSIIKDMKEEVKKGEGESNALNEKFILRVKENLPNVNINDNELSRQQHREGLVSSNKTNIKKEQINTNKLLFDNKVDNGHVKEMKKSVNNSNELPKGPILSALTKRVIQRSISNSSIGLNDRIEKVVYKDNSTAAISNLEEKSKSKIEKLQHEYSLPIALKMRNQTNAENTVQVDKHEFEDEVQVIHRDILEKHEREKREIDVQVEETNTKVASDIKNEKSGYFIKNLTINDNRDICSDKNGIPNKLNVKLNKNLTKEDTTEVLLIKTNMYLSGQEVANAVSMDPNIPVRGEYVKLKQRDLKSMNANDDYNV
ncbi:putative sodium-coupled neutral amino acid transporter 10 isoform X2 [Ceratina calcarata]|uniref:Sodium-coupled neutral amino acid transporter 10 isoform X2 n=1 Tax=Ceratina calcarata TaxID=156304 RepID=A0AAJ7WB92_9HYME|nr:putative sodium-coupled neutral amino acid transporter 10 isoform X2 [Ceratina calcarata]